MKINLLVKFLCLSVLALGLSACGASTPVPADTLAPPIPTELSPTLAPTSRPPTQVPTSTEAPPPPTPVSSPTETPIPPAAEPTQFDLTSASFKPEERIPERHACDGENLSPPLAWGDPPPGTQSFAIIFDDPDAVGVVGYTWIHWTLFDLPPDTRSLPEGIVPLSSLLPAGAQHGWNSFDQQDYGGPCPPRGQDHHYSFQLYALGIVLGLEPGVSEPELRQAMDGQILAQAELIGTYSRP